MTSLKFTTGNIVRDKSQARVNTVNCVGAMGKGIALAFKRAYPEMYQAYRTACQDGLVKVGTVYGWQDPADQRWIINFPTKVDWRYPSKIQWIKDGLNDLHLFVQVHDIQSIAIPPLGCGNGGLDWDDVKPLILEAAKWMHTDVVIYEPHLETLARV